MEMNEINNFQFFTNINCNRSKLNKSKKKLKKIITKTYSKYSGKNFPIENPVQNYLEIKIKKKLDILEIVISTMTILSLINGIAYYELTYNIDGKYINGDFWIFLYSCSFLSLFLFIYLIIYEKTLLDYDKILMIVNSKENLFTVGRYKNIIFYFFLLVIHPNPLCDGLTFEVFVDYIKSKITRTLNSIFLIIMLLRIIFILRLVISNSKFLDPTSRKICKIYNFNPGLIYSLKSLTKHSPIKIYFYSIITFTMIFSYGIRILERPISKQTGFDFDNLINSIWFVVVTILTIGYGDINVRTYEGRILAMAACFFGLFFMSMTVVNLTNIFSFNLSEINSFLIIEKAENYQIYIRKAKNVIYNFVSVYKNPKYRELVHENSKDFKKLKHSIINFNQHMKKFESIGNQYIRVYSSLYSFYETHEKSIEKRKDLKFRIEKVKSRMHNIIKRINDINN